MSRNKLSKQIDRKIRYADESVKKSVIHSKHYEERLENIATRKLMKNYESSLIKMTTLYTSFFK